MTNRQSTRTLVALATYNEVENLPELTEAILRVLPAAELLIVDDNSPVARDSGATTTPSSESRLHCLHRAGKLGLGSATLDAFRWALNRDYDVVVTMDADWSNDPNICRRSWRRQGGGRTWRSVRGTLPVERSRGGRSIDDS